MSTTRRSKTVLKLLAALQIVVFTLSVTPVYPALAHNTDTQDTDTHVTQGEHSSVEDTHTHSNQGDEGADQDHNTGSVDQHDGESAHDSDNTGDTDTDTGGDSGSGHATSDTHGHDSSGDSSDNTGSGEHHDQTNDGHHEGGDGDTSHHDHGDNTDTSGGGSGSTPATIGSITVCTVLLDSTGALATTSPAGITFTVPGVDPSPVTSRGPATGVLGPSVFTTPMTLNTKVLSTSVGNDAQCVTYPNLTIVAGDNYYFGQEVISDASKFETPKYTQHSVGDSLALGDFTPYSGELYDTDAANDESRNFNSDGHMPLTVTDPTQILVVLNQLKPAATSTGTDTGGGQGGGEDRGDTPTSGGGGTSSGGAGGSPIISGGGGSSSGGGVVSGGGGTPSSVTGGGSSSAPSTGGEVLGTSTEAVTCGPLLKTYLRINKTNDVDEVRKLQAFLNSNLGINLPVTGFFGPLTYKAVGDFQVKYWQEVLSPWVPFGLETDHTPTQYVYKTTQREINNLYCPSLNLPTPLLP